MCPNDHPNSLYQPLMMSSLFDSEAGSDVTFLVGHEPETWRFPGHRRVLMESNEVFKAMLRRDLDEPQVIIRILDVDGRAFDLLLRYLYKEDISIQTVCTALATLYAAQKYLCPGLMHQCITFLDNSININNALQIYEHIRIHSGQSKRASAPTLEQITAATDRSDNFEKMLTLCNSLLDNCLLYIDTNAIDILSQESIEDLPRDTLLEIIDRDTLNAPEILIYKTLERWSNRECKRHHLELSQEHKRYLLGDDLLFSVRFLLMTGEEYYAGPMINDSLLTSNEKNVILGYLLNFKGVTNNTNTINDIRLAKFKKRRIPPGNRNHLRQSSCEDHPKKKSKKQKKKENKNNSGNSSGSSRESSSSPNRCSGNCVRDYFFRVVACIFD